MIELRTDFKDRGTGVYLMEVCVGNDLKPQWFSSPSVSTEFWEDRCLQSKNILRPRENNSLKDYVYYKMDNSDRGNWKDTTIGLRYQPFGTETNKWEEGIYA